LLNKLKTIITNTSWDTRIAGSKTIENILNNISNINDIIDIQHDKSMLLLENFDLNELLANKCRLLSSHTQKYDYNNKNKESSLKNEQQTSNNDQVKEQRKLLYSKLGIDVSGAINLDTTHIFTDEDLQVPNDNTISTKRKAEDDEQSTIDEKRIKIEEETTTIKKEETNLIVEDSDENLNIKTFYHWLLKQLFNAEWEKRHGAATCIREICRRISSNELKSKY
jgi:antitoxin component of RelBE/YafQ-DinJ toxin-antitoxin module